MSPTAVARSLIASNVPTARIAVSTGLHEAYIRKIKQRDEGADQSWAEWRARNPNSVRQWRAKQNRARKAARASRSVTRLAV